MQEAKKTIADRSPDDWPEREELRRWLVETVAPRATGQLAIFRLVTSDGVRWLAEAMRDEGGTVHASVYWESTDDPSRRTHEWDAEVEGTNIRWPLGDHLPNSQKERNP
ncbi:MAG TPA: hypothetical protein VJ793_16810 [Anaerolineae bacterium]|nr:hypothetical protein [Anaerolineae bacterium]